MRFNTIEKETKLVIRNNDLRTPLLLHMIITKDADKARDIAVQYFDMIFKSNPTFALKIKGLKD